MTIRDWWHYIFFTAVVNFLLKNGQCKFSYTYKIPWRKIQVLNLIKVNIEDIEEDSSFKLN